MNKQNIKNSPLNNKYKVSQIQLTILSKMKPNNRMQQIEYVDKIKIRGQEKPDNLVESVDELEIIGQEKTNKILENIDELEIIGEEKPDNEIEFIYSIAIIS